MQRWLALLSLLVWAFVGALPVGATIWIVDSGGGGDFVTIQAALSAAANGDEIIVNPGAYTENVNFLGKGICLRSAAGADQTMIDGSKGPVGAGSCVFMDACDGSGATLAGFTLTGGHGTEYGSRKLEGLDSPMVGGGVYCRNCSPTIRDCRIVGNVCDYAAGIFIDSGAPEIADCVFLDNIAATYGGGVAGPNAAPRIANCCFEGNLAQAGDGTIHVTGAATIEDCQFRENRARAGAAINAPSFGANFNVARCVFAGNSALVTHGGAIRVHEASVQIIECLLVDNTALLDGGGIAILDGAQVLLDHCTLYSNSAGRNGGSIAVWAYSSVALTNCIVALSDHGGGVFGAWADCNAACSDVWGNVGGNYVGLPDPTGQDGNVSGDPLFCGPSGGDFSLASDSPCAPDANPSCGLIGAYAVGCGATFGIDISWGGVKALFRR